MSKTFESVVGEDVEVLVRSGGGVFIAIRRGGETRQATTLDSADAPALALAILEAAGWPNEYLATTEILRRLRELDEHVKAMEAEAEAQAKLEAEALELHKASCKHVGAQSLASWEETPEFSKNYWVAIARRARELNKEATK